MADAADCCGCCCLICACAGKLPWPKISPDLSYETFIQRSSAGCGRLCFFCKRLHRSPEILCSHSRTFTSVPCFKHHRSKEEEEDEAYAQAAIFEGEAFYAANGAQSPYTYQQPTPHGGPKLPEPAHMSYPPNPSMSIDALG
jgi:hypothetical protein